jgi:TolB-like protein
MSVRPAIGARPLAVGFLLLGAAALAACGGPTRFIDPEADLGYYEKVGVIPFTALSDDFAAGQKLTNIFFTELLRKDIAQVVEPGQFAAVITKVRSGVPAERPWSTQDLARLGEEAGVQAVFLGTVRDFGMTRDGRDSFPLVSVELRLVDAATGRLVWSASETRRGGPGVPLLGLGETHTLGELGAKVCRQLLDTLGSGANPGRTGGNRS